MIKLNNGAKVLYQATTEENFIVLATWGNEYICWFVTQSGHAFWGVYSDDFEVVKKKYLERIKNNTRMAQTAGI